jgi:hypothetical protein
MLINRKATNLITRPFLLLAFGIERAIPIIDFDRPNSTVLLIVRVSILERKADSARVLLSRRDSHVVVVGLAGVCAFDPGDFVW